MLRFHLTYVDPTQNGPGELPRSLNEGEREDLMKTKARLDELERTAATERLLELSQKCAQLHVQRLGTPQLQMPPSMMPSMAPRDVEDLAALKHELASLNGALRSSFLDGPAVAPRRAPATASVASTAVFTRNPKRRAKAAEMRDGWYATFDYEKHRPYYFQPELRVVQWEPPPGQEAVLVSYGRSPASDRPDRRAMLESPAPSEVGA